MQNYQRLEEEKVQQRSASAKKANPEFNPDLIPPNWQHAEEHESARQVGTEISAEKVNGDVNICDCCGFQVQREPIQLCQDPIVLSFLGAGYPMFFQFIKYCIYILLLILLCSGAYNIFSNMSSDDCISLEDYQQQHNNATVKKVQKDTKLCFRSFIMNVSIANKKYHSHELFIQQCINLGTIIAIIIMLQFFRKNQRIINEKADEANISPSDFTLMLKKVKEDPSGPKDYDDELKKLMFEKGIPGQKANVVKVNLCFDLSEIDKHTKEKAAAIKQYQTALKYKQKNGQFPDSNEEKYYKDEIQKHEQELEKLEAIFAEGKTEHFCGTAFVSFNTEKEKDLVYEAHKQLGDIDKLKSLCKPEQFQDHHLIFQGGKIVVEHAPEPNDILWSNQGISTSSKVYRRIVSTLVTIFMMCISFAIILYLNKLQIEMATHSDKANLLAEKLMAFGISMAIIIVNVIISMAIGFMSQFEAYSTVTRQNISVAKKNVIAQFFNIGFILFLVSYLFKHNIIGIGGLISNVTMIFITNMIIPPIKECCCPAYIINRIKLWLAKRQGQNSVLTQIQANKLHERPPFPIAVYYGQILKIMYFTAFYAPIIPIGIVFSTILLIFLYWTYKYNLLRRNCVLHSQSAELSIEMIEMLEFVCVIYSASNLIFSYILRGIESKTIKQDEDSHEYDSTIILISIIGLVLGILNACLPMQDINEKLFNIDQQKAKALTQTYGELEHDFDTNYDIENPATEERAKEERVKKFEKPKSVYQK